MEVINLTENDVKRIFDCESVIELGNGVSVTVDNFLNVAGFKDAPNNPTKEDLHSIDQGVKGYADLIEQGNYD